MINEKLSPHVLLNNICYIHYKYVFNARENSIVYLKGKIGILKRYIYMMIIKFCIYYRS